MEKFGYLYCLILAAVSILLIAKAEPVSRYLLSGIRNELIPSVSETQSEHREVLYEILPILAIGESGLMDEEMDLSYDDFEGMEDSINQDMEANIGGDALSTLTDAATSTDGAMFADGSAASSEDAATQAAVTEAAVTQAAAVSDVQGIVYSMEDLSNFEYLVTNCYAVDSSTSVNPDELNAQNLLSMDMSIDLSGDDYKVLIYHSHGSETFADSRPGVIEDTVIGVGDELARILEEDYGVKVYHDRNIYDTVDGVLDRSYAYTLSGQAVDEILAQYPSIQVILDVHRDGVREDLHLVRVINGKPTAQFMFLNGVSRLNKNGDIDYLYNPHKIENLSFSLQMYLKGRSLYGDLLRRIYIRGYSFNLNKMPRASLIEVGAQTNTVEEVKNAMVPLAEIIYQVLSGK